MSDDGFPFELLPGGADVIDAVPETPPGEEPRSAAPPLTSCASTPVQRAPAPSTACCAACAAGKPCSGGASSQLGRMGALNGGMVGELLDSLADRPGVCALGGAAVAWYLTSDQSKRITHALYGLVGGYVLALALRRQR